MMQPIFMDHRVKSSRLAQEVAISNLEIPPPVYEGFSTADLHVRAEEFSGDRDKIAIF